VHQGQRVVSLLPAATEIVCALGGRERLVGVSHECDFPREVRGLPLLTSSKVLQSPSSRQIDRDVRAVVRDALGVYDIDIEALRRADPDVIVTQDLCDVCAVSLDDVRAAVRALTSSRAEIVNLRPMRLADIWSDVRNVARALALDASELIARSQSRMAAIAERARRNTASPRVLTLEWIDPVMLGGTWMPELIELAGGRALVTRPGDHAPTLALEELAELAPDVVLIKPCGFELERSRRELDLVRSLCAQMAHWPAVARGAVWLADGNAFFNRPGPRIVESLEILAACVQPDEFGDMAERHRDDFERVALAG
jgi:iron complex transport system substrate-binding protein